MTAPSLHALAAQIRRDALREWRRLVAAGTPEVAEALAEGLVAAACTPLGAERFDILSSLEKGMQSLLPAVRLDGARAAAALGRAANRSPGLVQELALHCTDWHEGVAIACSQALLAIGRPAAESCAVIDRLQSALEDRRPAVKRAGAEALVGLAPHLGAANEARLHGRAKTDLHLRQAIDAHNQTSDAARLGSSAPAFVRDERVPLGVQVKMLMVGLKSTEPGRRREAACALRALMRQGTRIYGWPTELTVEERRERSVAVPSDG